MKQWVVAYAFVLTQPKSISAKQLQDHLGIGSYKCAWHLLHRVRKSMEYDPERDKIGGTVEVDECYLGARGRGRSPGRSHSRIPIVVAVSRSGQARARAIPNASGDSLLGFLLGHVSPDSAVFTDEWRGYSQVPTFYKRHEAIQHAAYEYARGEITTNRAESFFAIVRRAWYGTFHWFSRKHATRYAQEFARRWSVKHKPLVERMREVMFAGEGRRLTYDDLVDGRP